MKFLWEVYIFDRPMRPMHFQFADIQFEPKLIKRSTGKERYNFLYFVLDPHFALSFHDIADYAKFRIEVVADLICEDGRKCAKLIDCGSIKRAVSLGD